MKESYMTDVSDYRMDMMRKAWPELNILWTKDVGDYQGTIYVVGYADGKILASGLSYGSCSGCGAWEEYEGEVGGQPQTKSDFVDSGIFSSSLEDVLKWADEQSTDSYQSLTKAELAGMKSEIRRAFNLVK